MRRANRLILVLAGCAAVLLSVLVAAAEPPRREGLLPERPELAYLKQVNAWRPPADPQLLFLLMGQYANAGRPLEGAAYLDGLRRLFDPQLNDTQRALYLTAIASLRAGGAASVPLLQRIGWVRDTLAMLDEATRLTHGQAFITHWMSGVVRAQVPSFFGQREVAEAELRWCVQHADQLPHPGWLREVHFQLATLARERGDAATARSELAASGYASESKDVTFTTPFSEDPLGGHAFGSRSIKELVPGSVYLVSGYDFTEYYFIVSADRRELIAIDAGTRPEAAREAHEALRAKLGALPPLTTVLVTHAHWDHVGGQCYFRSLSPAPRFVGRGTYADELAVDAKGDTRIGQLFFGKGFRLEDVLAYKPDATIDRPTSLTIGGTPVDLIPARGGETGDAMLIHLPQQRVLFVGDILMPYFGAPFVNEGSIDGMLEAIEQVSALKPRLLLHGHEPLTALFDSTAMLEDLRVQLTWLRSEVLRQMAAGTERAAIQQSNPMPPTLAQSPAAVQLAYLVMRENMINRLFQQNSGYWRNGLEGLEAVSQAEHGAALVDYLGVDEAQIARAAERMMADGRHALAAQTLRWAQARLPGNPRLDALRREADLKLMEQYQAFNPFKFIVYAGDAGQTLPPMTAATAHAVDAPRASE
jgi:glyoxylase-like metal-dependent hydrolase (beta-lactamase superfamily II)